MAARPGGVVTAQALTVLAALLEARTGQQIASHRSTRVDTVLLPLMRERRFDTLDQLVNAVLDGRDPHLAGRVIDALVNGESSFFRDPHVFDHIVERVAEVERSGRRARIWSAGCSTGQEPLSLAIVFAERQQQIGTPIPEIVATDVSETAIARARTGCYTQFEVQRGMPIRRLVRWFEGRSGDEWTAKPELIRHIQYRQLNLIADPAPSGLFDLVLCRNVMLYLAPEPKKRAFQVIAEALRPSGGLLLGAGETVIGQTDLFQIAETGRAVYEKCATDGPFRYA
ncbi:CheR family methyltransferase [Sphingomonas sanguinis]|jgi:chemotaxis protein methyltransferase CheR|uniref:Protein-glutamate O-methyltransferase CheR n=1 Tax=Sphingomonas sanguinis TaxID=33051 RepID=A0A7Y7UQ46_9SPHN|nr:protein-glutamate O-methyltransferase CheR [Sphingomonas sanguinis]MBZ6380142.1 protein-glutamate O-methyltransferase CheR [Sphingomonas sanguinis]NNG48771.1 protein-glutamate O-methyltransferase CheR [Sphingomonas sanguinis]NNG52018.1 protein-glutamate O-methyltransferase CheR [Sphingomonas sanguinis]NVP29443.1 protein-glutamate O-methyltransferase CheR [Sphingomonas sanguinis]